MERVIVVGGGAAGLMAAGRAAESGASVLLLEKTARLGQKLRLTGGGHGNLTHTGEIPAWMRHLGPQGRFLHQALARLGPQALVAFCHAHGLPTVTDEEGRVHPVSRNAHDIVRMLRAYCLDGGVQFRYESPVSALCIADGVICGVQVGDLTLAARCVILATGGMSYPQTGSTGDGYALARATGHTVTPLRAGLTPLIGQAPWLAALQGVSLRGVAGWIEQGGVTLGRAQGDLLFTGIGASGPLALNLSLHLGDALTRGDVRLRLDLAPGQNAEALGEAWAQESRMRGRLRVVTLLQERMPKALAQVLAERCGLAEAPLSQLSAPARRALAALTKCFDLPLSGAGPLERAMVTLGGVALGEVEPTTMASRLVRGLYFAGELLDVAGETGGYNLQIAFSTGYVAGDSAAAAIAADAP